MSDDAPQEEHDEGAPAWVMTFADLMSLLMCFFVLLLAFSEMDVEKFKQLSGSMKNAFGVQREIKADELPKGTSIIAREFSPGKPEPTPFRVIEQQTTDDTKDNMDFSDGGKSDAEKMAEKLYQAAVERMQKEAEDLVEALQDEIEDGALEIEWNDSEITIRLRERGTFHSGEAEIKPTFFDVLLTISDTLNHVDGKIIVAGHTDNLPISNYQFRSNWELSAARAANVVHHLEKQGGVQADRLQIQAHADTIPIASNTDYEGRAKNRRVEIIIKGNSSLYLSLDSMTSVQEIDNALIDQLEQNALEEVSQGAIRDIEDNTGYK